MAWWSASTPIRPAPPVESRAPATRKWVGRGGNKKATDQEILSAYDEFKSTTKIGNRLGLSPNAICIRLQKLGIARDTICRPWTTEEDATLAAEYPEAAKSGTVATLASKLGRTRPSIAQRVKKLGLPRYVEATRPWLAMDRRTEWRKLSAREKSEAIRKSHATKMARYGTLILNNGEGLSWKAGWREFGGRRIYFRSRWEANWGRYLEWLKQNERIAGWEHEPVTFWFEKIRRGSRSYLPDFRVTELSGSVIFHEVKGWMDRRSKTKIKRMGIYHKSVKLLVIQKKTYKQVESKVAALIEGWEYSTRS
jgi:biotin operon repressor